MYLFPALRLGTLAGDASKNRKLGNRGHQHKCSCGDKLKQRCFKSHESSIKLL